jgi:(p)ppGpp synthase/HD superfamily hydrolase
VAAGLLHDVLSDTRVTAWQLEEHVPRSCVELVGARARGQRLPARRFCSRARPCRPTGRALTCSLSPAFTTAALMLHCPPPHPTWPPAPTHQQVEKVTRLSEVSQLYRDNAHSLEAASILHMLTSMSDVSALLVKLADRLHNMRTVGALSRCKQVRTSALRARPSSTPWRPCTARV